jgi:hypothetical protein
MKEVSATTVRGAQLENTQTVPLAAPPGWLTTASLSWQYPSARRLVSFAIEQEQIALITATEILDDPALDW